MFNKEAMFKFRTFKGRKRLEFRNSEGEMQPVDCETFAEMWAVTFAIKEYNTAHNPSTNPVRSLVKDVRVSLSPDAKTYIVWIEEVRV